MISPFLGRLAFWGAVGALVALPLDALHVVTGVLTYRTPRMGLQDWWAVPLFVGAGLALGLGHRYAATPLAQRMPAPRPMPSTTWVGALAGLAALVVAYASSGALQGWPLAALCAYSALWIEIGRAHV